VSAGKIAGLIVVGTVCAVVVLLVLGFVISLAML